MQLICPFANKEPNLVLIEARKNANPRLAIEENLIVYKTPGEYTDAIKKIYSSFE
jgi:tRNA1Val (adenine37-N6)-methyltransferase